VEKRKSTIIVFNHFAILTYRISAREELTMSTKDEYLAKLKTQLDSWQAEADELEAKASDAMDDLKPEIDAQIANLRLKFAEGETKFNELADATEEKWEELKVDADAMFDKLIGDFKEDIQVATTEAKGLFAKIKSLFS
jgi:predicted  nucleic acid-binding Zn-ribbon protein